MARKAIQRIERPGKPPLSVGHFNLDLITDNGAGWQHAAHDGDTVNNVAAGYFPVRFLGVDTPEVGFNVPLKNGSSAFKPIDDPAWQEFLADPFATDYAVFNPALDQNLETHLRGRIKTNPALNHARHAKAGREALMGFLKSDMQQLGKQPTNFLLFHAYAYEFLDRYGRLLAFVHPDQPSGQPRLPSYNDRSLAAGVASPYFIWPNIDPFLMMDSPAQAVIPVGKARDYAEVPGKLRHAREAVQAARANRTGIFELDDPLQIHPFELRFLADRRPPARWVIDLSRRDDVLIEPQAYYEISNVEDRLYISGEHVGLFESVGWRRRA